VDYFLSQVVSGLSLGFVYAGLALALVIVYQGSGILNFAQGELATLSTFMAWSALRAGLPWWAAVPLVIAASFLVGVLIQRLFMRPVERAAELSVLIVTLAVLLGVNGTVGAIWGFFPHAFESPFGVSGTRVAGILVTAHQVGVALVMIAVLAAFTAFIRLTPAGLRMRAAAQNPVSSRLLGIRVGWMLALGWGLAAVMGAITGILSAPLIGLDTNVFLGILLYAFAAAALGGFGSMPGAVVGGLVLGLTQTLAGAYVRAIGYDLNLLVPMALILGTLLIRPSGLFGRASAVRV